MAGLVNSPPAGSAGQVQFNDGSGAFGADANLHWDNTNKRLGVGTSNPELTLDVNGSIKVSGTGGQALQFVKNNAATDNVLFYDNSVATNDLYVGRDSANTYFRTSGAVHMSIVFRQCGHQQHHPCGATGYSTPGRATPGLNISQTGPNSFNAGTNDFYYNQLTISNDQISASNPPGGGGHGRLSANNIYTYGFGINMHNGGNDTGSKAAFTATLFKDTNSNPGAQPGANVSALPPDPVIEIDLVGTCALSAMARPASILIVPMRSVVTEPRLGSWGWAFPPSMAGSRSPSTVL
jgi:hypothetical protein